MQKLSRNKAADEKVLVAKHLFLAGGTIKEYLATLFDGFVRMQYVPGVFQTWVIILIYSWSLQLWRNMYLPDPDQAVLLSHYSPGIEAKHNSLQESLV